MDYYSHVLYLPTSAPFDHPERKWPSFIGEFVTPIVASHPGLTYWFSYYGDHAKFRVYTDDYEAIRRQIEAERDRLGLEDRGSEKTLTLIEDIGGGRFISPNSKSNPLQRAELILRTLCANANLIVDSVVKRDDGYWQFEENLDIAQNPDKSHLFSVNHLFHNMSTSQSLIFSFERNGNTEMLSYYYFSNDSYCQHLDPKDYKWFWLGI